jgi:TPP-dependent pyruvate/acetoin dehydrogenase alpha subunit
MTTLPIPTQENVAEGERAHLHHMLRQMLLIRRFEEKCAEVYTASKIRGFMHLYIGEEAIGVGVMQSLRPEDSIVATYREHGQALARGVSADLLMAEMYGKLEGCARGRGGSMHIFDKEKRFFGGNAIVGSHIPVAVGLALADKKLGRNIVTCCFSGTGPSPKVNSTNPLWPSCGSYPCCSSVKTTSTAWLRDPLHSIGDRDLEEGGLLRMVSERVDGMDVLAVEEATARAVKSILAGEGPRFLECLTYRFRAHSMFDAELYRTRPKSRSGSTGTRSSC